jgi:2-polyprenyl-3-methyl-5-hydroxy-6-metoxy-1,4-benzoquinol methylase
MLLTTTSHSILLVDEASGLYRVIEKGNGLYYGIASKSGFYYVAARRRLVSSSLPLKYEDGEIRVFDKNFKFIEAWKAPFLLRDIHQISFVDDDLFITCSYDNFVAVRRKNEEWEKWYPLGVSDVEPLDLNHINSISTVNGQIALVAHNHTLPSEIYFFDKADLKLLRKEKLGAQAHNFWIENSDLFTCSSGQGAIVSKSGRRIMLGDFPRGFANGGEYKFVGLSEISERNERDFKNVKIAIFDDNWNKVSEIVLGNEGLILDLLYLDSALLDPSLFQLHSCWCGNSEFIPFSSEYGECGNCGTLVNLKGVPSEQLVVLNDETDFYGKKYWLEHQQDAFGNADIYTRARNDLTERNLHWLKTMLKFRLPPAKVMELGCSHGSFVTLLRQAGYDAAGVEMSPWVVEFGQMTFGVPISVGPVETLDIVHGSLDVIVLMDVLEHLPDPVTTMAHCLKLLKPDGILLIQTPQFNEEMDYAALVDTNARFLEMMIPDEHLYLFSEHSITRLFQQLDAKYVQFEAAIFGHYDMFFAVSRVPLQINLPEQADSALLTTPNGRIALSMLDLRERELNLTQKLQESESDRAARWTQIETLTNMVKESDGTLKSLKEYLKHLFSYPAFLWLIKVFRRPKEKND